MYSVCMAFLSFSFIYTLPNMITSIAGQCKDNCVWYDEDLKIINLRSLQETNGSRFREQGSPDYVFHYNPCTSFSLPQTQYSQSDCYGDVAICMVSKGQVSYQNIGNQSTVRCGFHGTTKTPQLKYTNEKNGDAIVNLKCDPTRIEDAKFEVINDNHNPRLFLLTHNCACPDGCPLEGVREDPPTKEHPPYLEYGVIGALSFLVIVVPCVVWQFVKRQNNGNDENRQLLDEENNRVVDYAANHFNDLDGAASNKDINVRGNRYNNTASLC